MSQWLIKVHEFIALTSPSSPAVSQYSILDWWQIPSNYQVPYNDNTIPFSPLISLFMTFLISFRVYNVFQKSSAMTDCASISLHVFTVSYWKCCAYDLSCSYYFLSHSSILLIILIYINLYQSLSQLIQVNGSTVLNVKKDYDDYWSKLQYQDKGWENKVTLGLCNRVHFHNTLKI